MRAKGVNETVMSVDNAATVGVITRWSSVDKENGSSSYCNLSIESESKERKNEAEDDDEQNEPQCCRQII